MIDRRGRMGFNCLGGYAIKLSMSKRLPNALSVMAPRVRDALRALFCRRDDKYIIGLIHSMMPPETRIHISLHSRSGMGAYAGAARRRVHIATVFLRPPSGHRPGRRQAHHAHILQAGHRPDRRQARHVHITQIGLYNSDTIKKHAGGFIFTHG